MVKSFGWKFGLVLVICLSRIGLSAQNQPQVSLPALQICEGDQVRIPVYVQHFREVLGFQFAIRWPKGLQFDSIQNAHTDVRRYLSTSTEDSILNVIWLDESLKILNLKDSSILFVLQLKRTSSVDIFGRLAFANEVSSPSVALSVAGEVQEDSIQTNDGSIAYTNYPVYQKTADSSICKGNTLRIGIQPLSPQNLAFRWSTQNTSAQIDVRQPGVFQVRITNAHCVREDSIRIRAAPEVSFHLAKRQLFCPNEPLRLEVKDTLQQSYRWSTGQEGSKTIVPDFGSYWLQASNPAGCTQMDTIQVEPKASAIELLKIKSSRCGKANGGLVFSTPIGATDLQLQIQNQLPVKGSVLEKLAAGFLQIRAQYQGCDSIFQVLIPDSTTLQGLIESSITPSTCGKSNGAISLNVKESTQLQYRINDRDFGSEQQFKGLAAGAYRVEVKNNDGCTLRNQVELKNIGTLAIKGAEVTPAHCQENNGQIKLRISGAIGAISYSLDSNFSAVLNQLVGLNAGQYKLYVRDSVCQRDTLINLSRDTSLNFSIKNIRISPERCNGKDGKIIVETSGNTSGLFYNIGGSIFSTPTIEGLSKGERLLVVQDSNGCRINRMVTIPHETQSILDLTYSSISNTCNQPEASLDIKVNRGGIPPFLYALQDSTKFQPNPNFVELRPGMYSVWVKDQSRCPLQRLEVNIARKDCKVFIPNAFSPNQDQKNDLFQILAPEGLVKTVHNFQIFDHWGNLVYRSTPNISFTELKGWNGEVMGKSAAQGEYLYVVELEYFDGFEKLPRIFRGTLLLVR
jgi:gliding motility-associated-like protein